MLSYRSAGDERREGDVIEERREGGRERELRCSFLRRTSLPLHPPSPSHHSLLPKPTLPYTSLSLYNSLLKLTPSSSPSPLPDYSDSPPVFLQDRSTPTKPKLSIWEKIQRSLAVGSGKFPKEQRIENKSEFEAPFPFLASSFRSVSNER